ncbi:hypothetical protein [Desulforapulum autotrophicum]|uniref:hypothetical protein n=1 Tax=Desulforapulum autotrophicum TaxID=2296 RepID=UPI00059BF007|nr:hypothetical protein [Desulforapulum autotrophicum]
METYVTIITLGAVALFLCTQRWFWDLATIVGFIASIFAMLASIIHFQILWALGFLALAAGCIVLAFASEKLPLI